jgi:HEAT repeat protein
VRSEPAEFQGLEGAELVFAELGAVIASSAASPEYKWEVLRQSFAIPANNKLFLNDLLVALQNTSDPDLHRRIQAELISRNDLSQLPDVSGVLLSDTLSETQKDLLLFTIGRNLKSERALPALVRLLQSSDPKVRVASTQALWHTASPSSISIAALTQALNDENPEVRYYAIRGLADATGEQQWVRVRQNTRHTRPNTDNIGWNGRVEIQQFEQTSRAHIWPRQPTSGHAT